jgi:cysteine-rich repeat protein
VVSSSEACDLGVNDGGYGGCSPGCRSLGPRCGDGFVREEFEECDDGNDSAGDGCRPTCEVESDCTVLWIVRPAYTGGAFGYGLAGQVDFDGDGVTDVLVGAPWVLQAGGSRGGAYVLSGFDGSELLAVAVADAPASLGERVAWAGERDGDGVPDIAMAANADVPCEVAPSAVYVVAGADGTLLDTVDGTVPGDCQGSALASAGDIDGDALDDLLVGASESPVAFPQGNGRVVLYAGAPLAPLWEVAAVTNIGLGYAVTVMGDANGDGVGDVVVSSVGASYGGRVDALDLTSGSWHWEVRGDRFNYGASLATMGDIDGDSVDDVLVGAAGGDVFGAPNKDGDSVQILSGFDGALLRTFDAPRADEGFGHAVARLGDLDGDAVPDVAVGAPLATPGAGRVFLFSGATGQRLASIAAPGAWPFLGTTLATVGDLDGDALPDVVAGAPGQGAVYAFTCAP